VRLGGLLFLAYLLIFALCFSYPVTRFAKSLRTHYLESVEEPLVDQANILAELVGRAMETAGFSPDDWYEVFNRVYARTLSAKIYEMKKRQVDIRVYLTDAAGRVIFDSEDPDNLGADYSQWRDVSLTLRGKYGARTTRVDPQDPGSSVLYVGAPIRVRGQTVGVLTVGKPMTSINAFLKSAQPEVLRIGALSAFVAISLSLLVSWWVSRQIQTLIGYANDVRTGKRVDLPDLARTELKDMGDAFDKMRESLEGKKYVEQYVQTLTHEIKSPISAILGAAELLEEEMPLESRKQFLSNIRNEAERIQDLVERMLKLSELETKKSLETLEVVPMAPLVRTVLEGKGPMLSRKRLEVEALLDEALAVQGDPFLLHQAIANLLQNAIDFSPAGGRILLRTAASGSGMSLTVEDRGPGIPAYAQERIFQKFFSLKRPDTGKKSTGLGLNFVREVASLHKGRIQLENLPSAGFRASLFLPVSQ
jgi:two-component system, OmpR family, sensor histidine kinase CreC